ncbi:MAG: hypothetical protein OXL37_02550 [Chloroflexota bacterium]|nr:hypothetical protein [Chloroflexota bacterium]MDE2960385.1 hypothetical protein [Chloroflexota bacterium]
MIAHTTHISQADNVRERLTDENILAHNNEIIGDRPEDATVVLLLMPRMSELLDDPEFADMWLGTEPVSDNQNQ